MEQAARAGMVGMRFETGVVHAAHRGVLVEKSRERQGVRVLRDPFSSKPFVQFYTTKRVGGDLIDSDAIKLLKFGTS